MAKPGWCWEVKTVTVPCSEGPYRDTPSTSPVALAATPDNG
jgi:hypothetical protein